MIWEHKIYTVKQRDVQKYLEFLVKLFALLEKHGWKSIGPFRTTTGNLFDIVFLNGWESMEQREKARIAGRADEEVKKLTAPEFVTDVVKKTSMFLEDV